MALFPFPQMFLMQLRRC